MEFPPRAPLRYQPVGPWSPQMRQGESVECRPVTDQFGGPAWSEVRSPRFHHWERQVASEDGPDWKELDLLGCGEPFRSRQVSDPRGQLPWTETWHASGRERKKDFEQLALLCQQQGQSSLRVGEVEVRLLGKLDPGQRAAVEAALNRLPASCLWDGLALHFSQESFKEVLASDGQVLSSSAGIAVGKKDIFLYLPQLDAHVIAHELGHVVDQREGQLCLRPPWGQAPYLSRYAATSADEDLAETFAVTMLDWRRLQALDADGWEKEPARDKKLAWMSRVCPDLVHGPYRAEVPRPLSALPFIASLSPAPDEFQSPEWLAAAMRPAG